MKCDFLFLFDPIAAAFQKMFVAFSFILSTSIIKIV